MTTTATTTKFKTLQARYPGSCRRCGGPIAIGQTIRYGGKGLTYHLAADCGPIGPVLPVLPDGAGDAMSQPDLAGAAAATPVLTPAVPTVPVFEPQEPTEGWTDYGRRALLFVMRHGDFSTWRLDDHALEACAEGARMAATARGLAADVAEHLAGLERQLRGLVRARKANAAAIAALSQAETQAEASTPVLGQPGASGGQSGPAGQGGQGGGGAKVPRTIKPKGQPPVGGMLRPVPALSVPAADLF